MFRMVLSIAITGALCVVALAQSTEFTYQGNLSTGTPPVPTSVNHDFEFRLFSVETGGSAITALQRLNVPISNGSFSVKLDFGAQFPANTPRYLEIAVRPTVGGSFQALSPRTQILSSPFSVRSKDANNADNATNATSATNALQLGGVAANQYVLASDPRMTDARNPLPNSANYIQNQNAGPQTSSNFNISGNGKADVFDASTQFNINGVRMLSNSGSNNFFAGQNAGAANTGPFNAFAGYGAGAANTAGGSNSFFGYNAGNITQTGDSNSFFGSNAGGFFSLGSQNTFIGANAGMNTLGVSANENTFVGSVSGLSNSTGRGNTMLGFGSGVSVGTLSNATAIGNRASVAQNNSLVLGSINGVNFCSPATNCADTNVGIGTTSPSERLHVVGNGLFTGNLSFSGTLNGNGSALTNLNAGNITAGTLAINRGGTGLSSPGAAGTFLRSNGTSWTSSALMAADIPNLAATYIQNTTSPQTANFNISGNGIVGGSVGIGTSTPSSKMHVFGNGGLRITADSDLNAGFGLRLNNSPKWSVATVSPGQFQIFNDASGQNAVWIDPANNNVGIGTTTPSERLEVAGNIKASGKVSGDGSDLTNVTAPRTTTLSLLGSLRWDLLGQKTVSVGPNPMGVAFDGANIWVTNHGSSSVTKLRSIDGANLGTFGAGSGPEFVAFDGANIWVTNNGSDNNLTKLRASDGANLGTFTVDPFIRGLAFDGTNIWVTSSCNCGTKVTKVRPSDGAILGFINLSFGPNGIAFDGANIWITHLNDNKVTKLRTSDGADLGTFNVAGSAPTGVAFDGGSIWVVNSTSLPGGNSVTRLRASDGANLGTITVGSAPLGIAFDGTNIWVSNSLGNSVTRLRAQDGINLGTFPVGSAPEGVVFDGANIWVANRFSGTVTKLSAFP